jgi:hypothetical protein
MNRALDEATQGSGLFEDRFQKIEYLATRMDRDVGKRLISIEGETAGWHKTMHTVANEAAKKRVAQEDDRVTEKLCKVCAHYDERIQQAHEAGQKNSASISKVESLFTSVTAEVWANENKRSQDSSASQGQLQSLESQSNQAAHNILNLQNRVSALE